MLMHLLQFTLPDIALWSFITFRTAAASLTARAVLP